MRESMTPSSTMSVAMRTAASAGWLFHEETDPDVSFARPRDRALASVGVLLCGAAAYILVLRDRKEPHPHD